jgi:hypothetical protein
VRRHDRIEGIASLAQHHLRRLRGQLVASGDYPAHEKVFLSPMITSQILG